MFYFPTKALGFIFISTELDGTEELSLNPQTFRMTLQRLGCSLSKQQEGSTSQDPLQLG